VFTLLAVTPSQLSKNLNDWLGAVGGLEVVAGVAAGVFVGLGLAWYYGLSSANDVLVDAVTYRKAFQREIATDEFRLVKVFGYTGETVLNDLFNYEDRYKKNLSVRMLERNWVVEMQEEKLHNERPENQSRRPWDKSSAIRESAQKSLTSPHEMKPECRYYREAPHIKGVILCSEDHVPQKAFISFFDWEALPKKGGSQFKGLPDAYIELGAEDEQQHELLRAANSQFDLMWTLADSCEAVFEQEEQRQATESP